MMKEIDGCFFADGSYLVEMDRLLRPGGYFVLSGPPVNWVGKERDFELLQELIVEKLCFAPVAIDDKTAIWKKPMNASCVNVNYILSSCKDDDPDNAWSVFF